MYPANYFALFPPFPRENKAFVAMSFDPRFHARWENVIAPAIRSVLIDNIPLEPYRVDTRLVSDSILTDILGGVTNHRVIFADVTSLGVSDGGPIRNGNVMYEVGIAHAARLPEEVIIFRSDSDRLLFDVANVRINSYDPDGYPDEAVKKVTRAIIEALKEVDLKRNLAVKAVAESLDFESWIILAQAAGKEGIRPPSIRTMGQVMENIARLPAITRLLDLGALSTTFPIITAKMIADSQDDQFDKYLIYRTTPFGRAVLEYIAKQMNVFSPELHPFLENIDSESEQPD